MKTYDIWAEGYAATGNRSHAFHVGSASADSFEEACLNYAKENSNFAACFDPKRGTYWGCRLFDNEAAARLSFG